MPRNDQATRILRIVHLLEQSHEGLRVNQLLSALSEEGYACTRRTVYRDLEAIQACGFPVENSDSGADSGVWKLSKIKNLSAKVWVSYEELMALFMARESLKSYQGSSFFASLNNFFYKLENLLGEGAAKTLEDFCSSVAFKVRAQWSNHVPKKFIEDIHSACTQGLELRIQYKAASGEAAGQIKERRLGPECLYFADSGAYLLAKDLSKNELRLYSLSRITDVQLSTAPYESTLKQPQDFLANSLGLMSSQGLAQNIIIHLEGPLVSYVKERKWHTSQEIELQQDGSIKLKLSLGINQELVSWILSLGQSATVIEPKELAQLVLQEAQEVQKNYTHKKAA